MIERLFSALGQAICVMTLMGFVGGCRKQTPPQPVPAVTTAEPAPGFFRDAIATSGIDLVYKNGDESNRNAILESLGGGVAMMDYDQDGLVDLFFPGGGHYAGQNHQEIVGLPPKLYRNLGEGRFQDVTAAVGLNQLPNGQPWFYSHGVAVADYNRDGFPDLFMTGYGRVALWRNDPGENGQRRFTETTRESGLAELQSWSSSAAMGDLDGDGYPDLYVCHYVNWSNANDPPCPGYFPGIPRDICSPKQFQPVPDVLFRNRGDGTFENVSADAGIRLKRPDNELGKGLGVLFVDVNLDGKPDVYVANDTTDNFLYLNASEPGRIRFEDRGNSLGVHRDGGGAPNASMGIDASDYEGSGRPSIWVANYENELHALYRNIERDGRMIFAYSSAPAGLAAIGRRYVAFGTLFFDYDRDGWDDLVLNNGHVVNHHPQDFVAQPPVLFHNVERNQRRFFVESTAEAGPYFQARHRGRGLAVGDLRNIGRPDLVFCNTNALPGMLLNECHPERHWLGLQLQAKYISP